MSKTLPKAAINTGTFTIQNVESGEHRTFRISRERGPTKSWAPGKRVVALLAGPESYEGFGFAEGDSVRVWTKKRGQDKPAAFDFFASMLGHLMGGIDRMGIDWTAKGYVLRGEARCRVCGRALTTPESIDAGIGPVCGGRK